MVDVVAAGHICLDLIPDLSTQNGSHFDRHFQPGHLIETGRMAFAPGGSAANTGLALHRLGLHTKLIAKTGADPLGDLLRARIAAHDPLLAAGIGVDKAASTSYSVVISPEGSDRRFLHHPGANDQFTAADVPSAQVQGARHFHFGYPPLMAGMFADDGAELHALFRRVKGMGLSTSLDMAFPDPHSAAGRADWRRILQRTLPYVDLFMPSLAEIAVMLGLQSGGETLLSVARLKQIGDTLLSFGAKIVVLKLGEWGLYCQTRPGKTIDNMGWGGDIDTAGWSGRQLWRPCFAVTAVGATGAGDSTVAGFLAGLLRGAGPETALEMGTAVGACCVEAVDAFSGLRSWSATKQRIAAGWPHRPGPYPGDLETIKVPALRDCP